jgi:prevent-host-death family protein
MSMDEPISAADANRRFSQLLRGVREEHATYVVTSHGKPVAKITPADHGSTFSARALELLLARLKSQPAMNLPRWTRDEFYERSK